MLYVFYGTDTHRVADKANSTVAGLKKKRPDAQVFVFEGAIVDVGPLDELVEARGLFVDKHVVVLKQPFETEESSDLVRERLERFARSENIFILVEGKLAAEHRKHIKQHAEKMEEFAREAQQQDRTIFALGDALGARDRKALWTEYVLRLRAGTEPEALHGTLAWAARSMLLAATTTSADEAGMEPFPYGKFKRFARNYTNKELRALSCDLIALYHDAHLGRHDLATATERWVLSL